MNKYEYLDNMAQQPNRCIQEILLNDHHYGLWYVSSYKNALSPLNESWEIYLGKDELHNEDWKYFDNEADFEQFIIDNMNLLKCFGYRTEGISTLNNSIVGTGQNKERKWQLETNSDYWHTNKYNQDFDYKINQSLRFRFAFMARKPIETIKEFVI